MFQIYSGKKVLITGHTGFKGSWLATWLEMLDAKVAGYSLAPLPTSQFDKLGLACENYFENINDDSSLNKIFQKLKPDIVFHLAAQPLVRESYEDPVKTYETNILGSLKVYRASQSCGARALVSITTDKVYENHERSVGYHEGDRLGGHDPYSSSKACVELMTDSYRRSFLPKTKMLLTTVRAGNVIGGGDWAKDRLLPDLMQSACTNKEISIRNPRSVRPWQHVLEPLRGYLIVGARLLGGERDLATSFNFGPSASEEICVEDVCRYVKSKWSQVRYRVHADPGQPHEAGILKLDTGLAQKSLGWKPLFDFKSSLDWTLDWYKAFHENKTVITRSQISQYQNLLR